MTISEILLTVVSSHVRLDEHGVAWIDATRVKVIEVAMDWLANRSSAEEMQFAVPSSVGRPDPWRARLLSRPQRGFRQGHR